MSKSKESKLVPKLRFPEFNETWETEQLFKLLDYERPDNYIVKDTKYTSEGIQVLTANKSFVIGYTNESFGICKNIPAIIFDDFTTDKKYVDFPFKVKSSAIKILRTKDINNLKFIFELMTLIRFEAKEHKRYYISEYQTLFVLIPKYKEQKKIADCLSSLDDVITAESKKLEVLKEHKKGLLQNLFPQEGEKVPKLRFKEFKNSGDWKIQKLEKVYYFISTNSFSRDDLNYVNGEVKNIHYGDIHTKFSTLFDISKENVPFINNSIPLDRFKQENYCKEGDMVFADASEDLKDIGKSIEIVNLNNEKLLSGLHTLLARQINSEIVVGFGGYLFSNESIKKQMRRESQGTKVLGISATRLSNINISYPKDEKEQLKIVNYLSSLDDIIKAQTQKVEALKLHKKGLLQGLFPNINGVNE